LNELNLNQNFCGYAKNRANRQLQMVSKFAIQAVTMLRSALDAQFAIGIIAAQPLPCLP
jgi:hypothetical protein